MGIHAHLDNRKGEFSGEEGPPSTTSPGNPFSSLGRLRLKEKDLSFLSPAPPLWCFRPDPTKQRLSIPGAWQGREAQLQAKHVDQEGPVEGRKGQEGKNRLGTRLE